MSELMEELRSRLDELGVEWTDRSEEFEYKSGSDWPVTYHMERTRSWASTATRRP